MKLLLNNILLFVQCAHFLTPQWKKAQNGYSGKFTTVGRGCWYVQTLEVCGFLANIRGADFSMPLNRETKQLQAASLICNSQYPLDFSFFLFVFQICVDPLSTKTPFPWVDILWGSILSKQQTFFFLSFAIPVKKAQKKRTKEMFFSEEFGFFCDTPNYLLFCFFKRVWNWSLGVKTSFSAKKKKNFEYYHSLLFFVEASSTILLLYFYARFFSFGNDFLE